MERLSQDDQLFNEKPDLLVLPLYLPVIIDLSKEGNLPIPDLHVMEVVENLMQIIKEIEPFEPHVSIPLPTK